MSDPTRHFVDAVIKVLNATKPGEVLTYGEVAEESGYPGAARAVGNVLRRVEGLPWWRVVNSAGRLAPGNEARQAELLRSEEVIVKNGRVLRE